MPYLPPHPRFTELLARLVPLFADPYGRNSRSSLSKSSSTQISLASATQSLTAALPATFSMDNDESLFLVGKAFELALCLAGVKAGWMGLKVTSHAQAGIDAVLKWWGDSKWDGAGISEGHSSAALGAKQGNGSRFIVLTVRDKGLPQLCVLDTGHVILSVINSAEYEAFATQLSQDSDVHESVAATDGNANLVYRKAIPTTNGNSTHSRSPLIDPHKLSSFLEAHPVYLGAALGYQTPGDHNIFTPITTSPTMAENLYAPSILPSLSLRISIRPTRTFLLSLAKALGIPPPNPEAPIVEALPFVWAFAGRPGNLLKPVDQELANGHISRWDAVLLDYITVASLCHACGVGGAEFATGNDGWERALAETLPVAAGATVKLPMSGTEIMDSKYTEADLNVKAQEREGERSTGLTTTVEHSQIKSEDPWSLFD
ncbi:hypothetical protein HDU93_000474 [Gonapodya sp. JEL0774]|nr:hypothetical protein HDU93_000474 [Gonapodya sp. JEL0774]